MNKEGSSPSAEIQERAAHRIRLARAWSLFAAAAAAMATGATALGQGAAPAADEPTPTNIDFSVYVGPTIPSFYMDIAAAKGGSAPDGIEPLPVDVFTTNDFHADRDLWSDPRYFRCNSPMALDAQWGGYGEATKMIVDDDPATAAWGHCDRDYPREEIVSPYPFATAAEHYDALLSDAAERGGPSASPAGAGPSWNGRYTRNENIVFNARYVGLPAPPIPPEYHEPPQWVMGAVTQVSTTLSLLTPEYQERFVQQLHHMAKDNAPQWSLMYCRPDGLMRWWSAPGGPGALDITVTDGRVQFQGGTDNAYRNVHVGRSFDRDGVVPRLGADVPRWLGETIGFWDGRTLVTWTSNIQGWFTHASWEYSSQLQIIEIWTERADDAGAFVGLQHETVFYDPEALVAPVRDVRFLSYQGGFNEVEPLTWSHCQRTFFLDEEGRGAPALPGQTVSYTVEDLLDRPWARIWERYFEDEIDRPADPDIFTFE